MSQVKLDLVGHCKDFGLWLLHRVKWEPLEGFEQVIGMIWLMFYECIPLIAVSKIYPKRMKDGSKGVKGWLLGFCLSNHKNGVAINSGEDSRMSRWVERIRSSVLNMCLRCLLSASQTVRWRRLDLVLFPFLSQTDAYVKYSTNKLLENAIKTFRIQTSFVHM